MLLALAATPAPCLNSGFSQGLLRAFVVASELYPCSEAECEEYSSYRDCRYSNEKEEFEVICDRGPLLGQQALEFLLGSRDLNSTSNSMESIFRTNRPLDFVEFSLREDIQACCRAGWFQLRDFSRAMHIMRNEHLSDFWFDRDNPNQTAE